MTAKSIPQRVALHSVLRAGHIDSYRKDHARVPDDLAAAFQQVGIYEWEIWRSGLHIFHLVTCDDFDAAMKALEPHPANIKWMASIGVHIARFEGPDGEGLIPSEPLWTLGGQFGASERNA